MQLFSFIGRLFQKQEKTYNPAQWTVLGSSAEAAERNLLANNKEWVFIAADKIANATAAVRYKVMRYKANGKDEEVFAGPLVDFLENPSPNFTAKDFVYLNTIYKELTGNAFWERKGRRIMPLIPSNVTPVVSHGIVTAYKYSDGSEQRTILAKDVLHDRYVDPARPWWGVGKLAKIARWVDTSSYANEFLRRFFINGATFGGFIETEEESQERIMLIKAGLHNDHVGVENSHKIGVLPKGSKFTATMSKMSDMEMGATDDRYRDKILAGFGVPKTLVGLTTEVNRATAEASEYVFARYTIKPIVEDFLEFLNNNVAPVIDPKGDFYFACDEFVPINMEIALKEREISLGKQAYRTVNEVRTEIGLPPVDGGDVIYATSPFQVPLGSEPPEPQPIVPAGDEDTEDDEEPDGEPKKALPRHIRNALKTARMIDSIVAKAQDVATAVLTDDEATHKRFVARIDAHEKLVADKVKDFNNRQQRDVVQKLNQITKDVSKSDLFDMEAEIAILADFVSPILRGLMLEQAIEEYKAQGFPGTFNDKSPAIKRAVELAAKRLARSYNDTTADLLKQKLNDGIAAGDDVTKLAESINEVYAYSDSVRALMVAKTETVYIANEGSREAYKQSGIVKSTRWYTAEDELVCEWCGPQNGKVIGINEVFFNKGETLTSAEGNTMSTDYRAIDVPPLHPNCRCLIRPEEIEVN